MCKWGFKHIWLVAILGIDRKRQVPEFWPPTNDRAKSRDFQQWDERRNKGDVEV